ncbi:MAG: hypothetical protein ACYC37_09360 [Desulfobacteria bacterium]
MRGTRSRSAVKSIVVILCAAFFLTMSIGTVSRAVAADTWETWPKKTVEPGVEPTPDGAAQAGDAAGKKAAEGLSYGTIGWIAAGTAAIVGIAIAVGGGGGSTTPAHH